MTRSTTLPGLAPLVVCAALIYLPTAALKAAFGVWDLIAKGGEAIAGVEFGGDDE